MIRKHYELLQKGVTAWNDWRMSHPNVQPDLEGANVKALDLRDANLSGCNLRKLKAGGNYKSLGTNFHGADFTGADLTGAYLRGAILRRASFRKATLRRTNLTNTTLWLVDFSEADMHQCDLWGTSIMNSDLSSTDLSEARLHGTVIIGCDLRGADLSRSVVYGCSAWDVKLAGAAQFDLVITEGSRQQRWRGTSAPNALKDPCVTADSLEIAQFLYLILVNSNIRNVIDTVGKKAVLILGRFTPDRKRVLDGVRAALRAKGFVPIVFDFAEPSTRNYTETVTLLAHISRFVIADVTDPESVPHELQRIVPTSPSVPVQPIIARPSAPYAMMRDLRAYHWFLPPFVYDDAETLLDSLEESVIGPAVRKSAEIEARRNVVEACDQGLITGFAGMAAPVEG